MEKQYYVFDEKFILTDHVHSSVDIFGWQGCAIYGYAETIRVVKLVAWFLHLVCFFFGCSEWSEGKTTPIQNTHQVILDYI